MEMLHMLAHTHTDTHTHMLEDECEQQWGTCNLSSHICVFQHGPGLQPEQDSDTGSYAGQYMLDPQKRENEAQQITESKR
jgi:hypothetical protein